MVELLKVQKHLKRDFVLNSQLLIFRKGEINDIQAFKLDIIPLIFNVVEIEYDHFEIPEGSCNYKTCFDRICYSTAAILLKTSTFTWLTQKEFSD